MDLRQLQSFVAIAESGSLSAAAAAHGLAQSALSRHLAGLEHALAARLFERTPHGVVPTDAGTRLLPRARAILAEVAATRAELAAGGAVVHGKVAIATSSTVADALYGPLAQHLARTHPALLLDLHEGQDDLIERLAQGRLDLAIVTTSDRSDSVLFRPLYTEPVWLIGPPGDPALTGATIPPALALARDLILPVGEASLAWLHARGRALGVAPRCRLHAESLGTIRELVRRGLGCALLPYAAVRADVAAGVVSGAPITGFELVRRLGTPRGRKPGRAAAVVAAAIEAEVARMLVAGAIPGARGIAKTPAGAGDRAPP